eukprot:12923569-Prorocentrum_lima.AAC.1
MLHIQLPPPGPICPIPSFHRSQIVLDTVVVARKLIRQLRVPTVAHLTHGCLSPGSTETDAQACISRPFAAVR